MAVRGAKRVALKGKALASRLTGISTPIGGVSWKPPADERERARALLRFLEDRRALFHPYHMEVGAYVVESVLKIRERLTEELEQISTSSPLGESLLAMRAACRKFLDLTQKPPRRPYYADERFLSALGELRAVFGIHIARIACAYDEAIEQTTVSILPQEPERPASQPKKGTTTTRKKR